MARWRWYSGAEGAGVQGWGPPGSPLAAKTQQELVTSDVTSFQMAISLQLQAKNGQESQEGPATLKGCPNGHAVLLNPAPQNGLQKESHLGRHSGTQMGSQNGRKRGARREPVWDPKGGAKSTWGIEHSRVVEVLAVMSIPVRGSASGIEHSRLCEVLAVLNTPVRGSTCGIEHSRHWKRLRY